MTTITIRKPKHYNCIVDAVYASLELQAYEFLIFRGKALQRLENKYRFELPSGKWSARYKWPSTALIALALSLSPPSTKRAIPPEASL
jgi:hypothetical protein